VSNELELKDYLRIIRKRLRLIASVVAFTCALTALATFVWMDPVYEAHTKLIVNKKMENAVSEGQLDLNTVNLNIRLIDTYKEIIKTTAIMDDAVKAHPEWRLTSEELIRRIRVSSVNNTQVMTVSIQDRSYERAAAIVNAVSRAFIEKIPQYMQVDNVSTLAAADPAKRPAPVNPKPVLNLALAFVISLLLGLGIAFLLEYLDDTIRTDNDVERHLGLPTLSMVPRVETKELQTRRKSEYVSPGREQHAEARIP
jgi:capsular polysaccharide biosynthesis protein